MLRLKANYNAIGIYYCRKQVLKFNNSNNIVSEEDIQNLFMGFVKLIEKTYEIKASNKYKNKINLLEKELNELKSNQN